MFASLASITVGTRVEYVIRTGNRLGTVVRLTKTQAVVRLDGETEDRKFNLRTGSPVGYTAVSPWSATASAYYRLAR